MRIVYTLIFIVLTQLYLNAQNSIKILLQNKILENASISVLVQDLDNGINVSSYQQKKSCTPASTLKVISTATALRILGPKFCFKTKLKYSGNILQDGTLDGNLYIVGGGDPTLGSEKIGDNQFLEKWTREVKKLGISRINGQIIVDASIFDNEAINPKWTWEDMGNYYAAPTYGISYKDNMYRLYLESKEAGTTPRIIKTEPKIKELVFQNYLESSNIKFDSAYFYGIPESNTRIIRGEIPANKAEFIIKGDIPNPKLVLANDFQQELENNKIIVNSEPIEGVTPGNAKEILTFNSPTLHEIVNEINIHSNNHYAEHIFKYLGLKETTVASTNSAIRTIREYWYKEGLPINQLIMNDGCGLSPTNAVSAEFLVKIMDSMYDKKLKENFFINSLPVAGESGTLSSFLKNTPLQGKVKAKSGTISKVKCYTGYIFSHQRNFAFAILINNASGTSKQVTSLIENYLLNLNKYELK